MRIELRYSGAGLVVRLGVLAAMALLIALVSPEAIAQKKAKGKKGKKAAAAETEAQSEDPIQLEARTRYANGKAAFEKSDFATALVEFKAAYDAKPHPTVLKSIAECQVETGDIVGAIATLERYVADPQAADKPEVQKRLDTVKAMLATLEVTSEPAGASITLDGQATGLVTPASLQVGPGPHALAFALDGYEPLVRDVTAAKGDMALVAISLVSKTPAAPAQELLPYDNSQDLSAANQVQNANDPPPAFWAFAALTGIGLISGAVFGTMALNDEDKWKQGGGTEEEVRDSGKRNAIIADVSFGVALGAALTGTIILIVSRNKEKQVAPQPEASVSVVPVTGRDTIGLSAVVEF
ncbi:MAG: PEGA domain-containing protein [Myxococcota bacterium]|nr:PEGA domain-containing protein [Myxococcota bacterium]